jgi:hypothetical protein
MYRQVSENDVEEEWRTACWRYRSRAKYKTDLRDRPALDISFIERIVRYDGTKCLHGFVRRYTTWGD